MNPLLLTGVMASMKKEVYIVLVVIATLFTLPIFAVISVVDIAAFDNPETKLYAGPVSTKNTYFWGYCTFWAAKRREDIGKAIPNTWGDAHTWDDRARQDGYIVNNTPVVGAIMQTDAGELGHVAFVEKVNPDGTWEVSEMNVKGWDILSDRKFGAIEVNKYVFIH